MFINRVFELLILGLWLCIAVVLYIQNDLTSSGRFVIAKGLSSYEDQINVKRISVLDDNLFCISVQNEDKPIIGKLDSEVPAGYKQKLVKLLRNVESPKIILIQKQKNDVWLIKLNFVLDGKRVSLDNWLSNNISVKE
jgi:hypothetical protein